MTLQDRKSKVLKNSKSRREVYICYFDESGDIGISTKPRKHADWFVLNCLLVHETDWIDVLNAIVGLRQTLRDEYGLPPRIELKGAHFRSGEGIFEGRQIKRQKRMEIYRFIMNFQSGLSIRTFSVAVNKRYAITKGWNPRYCAWNFTFNRLNVMCWARDDRCVIFPDEGHGYFIRQCMRSMRRHNNVPKRYGPGTFRFRTERILEDPSDRRSDDSYFVQLADLNAYASHRSIYVDPVNKMARDMWDELSTDIDDVRLLDVNKNVGGWPPGIKKYPVKTQNPA